MFNDALSTYIFSWLTNQKLLQIYSEKKKPDVILTNSNHLAVGLKYAKDKMDAPIVLIKGKNHYAQKIIEAGKINNIPISDEPNQLADLFRDVREGKQIPKKYYETIARIYSQLVNVENLLSEPKKEINDFNEILFKKRKKEYEVLSINVPEKIELQLGKNLFALVKEQFFTINILGFQITNIKIAENESFENEDYCIKINGANVKQGKVRFISIDPFQQLCVFLSDVLTKHSYELLGRDDVLYFISTMNEKFPVLIQETMKYFSVGEIRQVLCGLLREKVSIQDISTIFESIADFGDKKINIDLIIENTRKSIGRAICLPYINDEKILKVIGLSYELETMIESHTKETEHGKIIMPDFYKTLMDLIIDALEKTENEKIKPIFLCSTLNRKLLYDAINNVNSEIVVLSSFEVPKDVVVQYSLVLEAFK